MSLSLRELLLLAQPACRSSSMVSSGDANWKRLEPNVIASPSWALEGRAFPAAVCAARAARQFVA